MESIELRIDENNEVTFKVSITGADEEPSVRFVCEGTDISYMFKGSITEDGEVRVIVPPMKGKIRENEVLSGKLEVFVEGRVFTPLHINTKFKEPFKVVAESVQVKNTITATQPQPTVSATITKSPSTITKTSTKQSIKESPKISDEMVNNIIRKLNSR